MKYLELYSDNSKAHNFGLLTVFVLSVLLGVVLSMALKASGATPDMPADMPVSQELLQNPMLSSWSASVKGRVIAKTEDAFTISHIIEEFGRGTFTVKDANDGVTMEITYVPGITVLKQDSRTGGKQITLEELAINSIVNGGVSIVQSERQMKVQGGALIVR